MIGTRWRPSSGVAASPNTGNSSRIPNNDSLNFELDDVNIFSPTPSSGYDRLVTGPRVAYGAEYTIVNRGGEQGAQHSQALHSWFAHVPGLRVVMPATVADARDLLIASVLCDDPVLYIDDRWLYEECAELGPVRACADYRCRV